MKVVQISSNGYHGSTGKIVRQLSVMMDKHGIDNRIVCSGYREHAQDPSTVCISSHLDTKIHQLLGYVFGNAGFHSDYATRKLIRYLEDEKPDIVHLHHLEGYFVNVEILLRYLKKRRFNTIWTMHDCWPFTGHCTHFTAVKCCRWKTGCVNCPQLKKYPYSLFLDRSKKLYQIKKSILVDWQELHIVNVSKWMQGIVSNSFLKKHENLVIYNGIDTDVFQPVVPSIDVRIQLHIEDKFVILGVASSWTNQKGLDAFLKLANFIGKDEVIVLVGLNSDQIKMIPDNIIGITRTHSQEELRNYYNIADVFLSLSLEETMGLVTVEAMACGTPVIVCNSSASPELVGKNCGIVLENRETINILSALQHIRKNGRDAYLDYCRQCVIENFTKKAMNDSYYNLYRRIYEGK